MRKVVGFSQRTKKSWLDAMLDHLGREPDPRELKSFLDQALKDDLPSAASRKKSSGILMRVWSKVPAEHASLRDRAIRFLPTISGSEWIWLHWGMAALAYPFFRDSAEIVGRILALQDDFTTSQVRDRMLNTWGDRATTREATQKLLNTLCDWEVLRPANSQGHFLLANKNKTASTALQLWLLEALLNASESSEIEAQQLLRLPEAFPFAITVGVADLRKSEYLAIHRQGLDMDMVGLHRKASMPEPKSMPKPRNVSGSKKPKGDSDTSPTNRSKPAAKPTRDTEKALRRVISGLLKKDDAQSLSARIDRYRNFHSADEAIEGAFEVPIKQCIRLYRDGHFWGCIAMSRNLIESIIRSYGGTKVRELTGSAFEKAATSLCKKNLISDALRTRLIAEWDDPPLNSAAEWMETLAAAGQESKAREVLSLLIELESSLRRTNLFP